jgi:hypothetical protein
MTTHQSDATLAATFIRSTARAATSLGTNARGFTRSALAAALAETLRELSHLSWLRKLSRRLAMSGLPAVGRSRLTRRLPGILAVFEHEQSERGRKIIVLARLVDAGYEIAQFLSPGFGDRDKTMPKGIFKAHARLMSRQHD